MDAAHRGVTAVRSERELDTGCEFNYTWDAENRLIAVQIRSDTTPANLPLFRALYGYDAFSRRATKTVERQEPADAHTGLRPGWVIVEQKYFFYEDGV